MRQITQSMSRLSIYCEEGLEMGTYKLCPPAKPASVSYMKEAGCTLEGAVLVSAGDIVELEVELSSLLPEPLSLANVVLVLVPYSNPPSLQDSGEMWLPI